MDTQNEGEREHQPERNSNTEYLPTKCRITRPPPPKPATNPLQFIKVAPCPLYRKAQEQIKKVEEIKTTRQHVREEAEDWQQNLDNWKSSRRKRQEHIIERVVEVKKFEQQEQENARRKSKTFSEIVEERSRGRPKFTIPILYEDDPNDLSDYGIGSNSSKANSVKDADTDDSSSFLDEKDQGVFDSSSSSKDANISSNQSQSEDETNSRSDSHFSPSKSKSDVYTSVYSNFSNGNRGSVQKLYKTNTHIEEPKQDNEVYTYEGAIQDYRSRIKSKINVSDTIFNRKEFAKPKEIEPVLSKGQLFKRKEIFEVDKPIEIHHYESGSAKRLSEDFPQSQSIKERLQNFEKCAEQQNKSNITTRRQQAVNKPDDRKNNNVNVTTNINKQQQTQDDNKNSLENKTSRIIYDEIQERSSSPETELYMNKLNSFNNDLDNLMCMKPPSNNGSRSELDDIGSNYNYSCSDREDSGIHTADVSCAVSQADEPIENEYPDTNTIIPSYLEKLNIKKTDDIEESRHTPEGSRGSDLADTLHHEFPKEYVIKETERFLENARLDSTQNQIVQTKEPKPTIPAVAEIQFDIYANPDFLVAPPKVIEPPKAKPPPPPPSDNETEQSNLIRLNSTKRIKKEIHLKRSSFLGLGEPYEDQLDPELTLDKPPDINSFLQKESKFEKTLYKKMLENLEGGLSKVESQDSGLDIERGRLSSDTWCSSIGDSSSLSHGRQDSEEDEIMKKEREIIELVEKEEKSRDKTDFCSPQNHYSSPQHHSYPSHSSDQDSEVLKVEHELLQLEKEQLKHQRDNFLLRTQHNSNRRSLDNICDTYDADTGINYRKSMPELQFVTSKEFSKTMSEIPIDQHQYRKSMPDIQQAYYKNTAAYQKTVPENNIDVMPLQHRKSLPELKSDSQRSAFYSPQMRFWQPIMPEKLSRAPRSREIDFPAVKHSRSSIPNLNALPKTVANDNWIQPRQAAEAKNYSQHWLYQEAELRRLSEQQQPNKNRSRQDKPLPDSVIKSLTQRVQNKARMENSINKDYNMLLQQQQQQQQQQHTYLNHHMQQLDHALPMSYRSPLNTEENQDRMLSVSGKKKCSYCGKELGRGAAMIIESLCLFYHMECFKCCVCHVQLGDGLMGTDVRVRNQKLHCHNCYSSDDGVKFSCV